uniref:Vesicle-fusing ATPase n=1 Tax=Aureoumbra lagunensis TaxID=44058 RepID=A0A7S3K6G5_9STRA|mmetsp:Transcript_16533/g.24833  ORF Transcript_16533/g.24833 Transcript_16533/m.24833 type:complete len:556 (+) Transcript_16533:84-1751(+)
MVNFWVLLLLVSTENVKSIATYGNNFQEALGRLMNGEGTTSKILESLPVASSEHRWKGARRPLVIPLGSSCVLHILPAGSVLGPASEEEVFTRVLSGYVNLRTGTELKLLDRCVCFGGSVCPRQNCEFRMNSIPKNKRTVFEVEKNAQTFDAKEFEIVAQSDAIILDAKASDSIKNTRRALGAIGLAQINSVNEAVEELWLEKYSMKENAEEPTSLQKEEIDQFKQEDLLPAEMIRLDDGEALGVAGLDDVLEELEIRLRLPLAAPLSLLRELGVKPVRGVIFWGTPGCGKTLLASQIAKALDSSGEPTIVAAPQLLDKYLGGSEANIRKAFFGSAIEDDDTQDKENRLMHALKNDKERATNKQKHDKRQIRCVVVDEIDAIAASRSTDQATGTDRARDSIVNQLLSILCGTTSDDDDDDTFLVLATTNRLDLIDEALLRPGRFEIQIQVTPPTATGRLQILNLHTKTARENGRLTTRAADALSDLAHTFPEGTTGASIAAIVRLAASFALERYFHTNNNSKPAAANSRRSKAGDVQIDLPDLELATRRVLTVQY